MSAYKILAAVALAALTSACASFPGGRSQPEAAAPAAEDPQLKLASLEAEVARLKSQNARLSNQVLELQRERDRLASHEDAEAPADEDAAAAPTAQLPVPDPAPLANAVVDDADPPALAESDVPVQRAPRLVQPTFAAEETVFANEAEGDIETESVLFGVHLASYRAVDQARAGWRQLQRENPDELGLLEPRVESIVVEDKGEFLRLIGGGFASPDKAEALCAKLKANGLFCSVASFEGARLPLGENGG